MKRVFMTTCLALVLTAMVFFSASATSFANQASSQGQSPLSAKTFKHACTQAKVGFASCFALQSTTGVAAPGAQTHGLTPNAQSPGGSAPYGPANLAAAYNLPTGASVSQTVAIVDAYDDPNAASDMNYYRSNFGLPACTSSNGCFRKVDQNGGTNYPTADSGWAGEISLDLDMVSAICNRCKILLVEAKSSSFSDLGAAVNTAVRLGATEVSNSYGGSQSSSDTSTCNSYFNHSGVAITASSGDGGQYVESPSDCPHVVAVGGTTLNSNGTETAWHTSSSEGAGGGCSSYITRPTWQSSSVTGCSRRAVSDVSAVADPATGVYVYDTYQASGWQQYGGTSASSPIIASVYALAGGVSGEAASIPWSKRSNGCLFTVGGKSYSYQAGLGSPNGTGCF
ncbi:peptidase S8 [Dictyobacter alpinus]|uniref:Peptidase S8 n=1 Tax=Dictyobacter alpinus TaxID=2014873 RepID=A0A402BK54_9CHLR|nr:peptidase S8 [Dictyobacter alpinus]GCE31728.1 peptidase S8 [Dictyobacter alpinus]